jgi:hypothetical protein
MSSRTPSAHNLATDEEFYQQLRPKACDPLSIRILTTDCFYSWTVVGAKGLIFCASLVLELCFVGLRGSSVQLQTSIRDTYDCFLKLYIPLLHRKCSSEVLSEYNRLLKNVHGIARTLDDAVARYSIPELIQSTTTPLSALTEIEADELQSFLKHSYAINESRATEIQSISIRDIDVCKPLGALIWSQAAYTVSMSLNFISYGCLSVCMEYAILALK